MNVRNFSPINFKGLVSIGYERGGQRYIEEEIKKLPLGFQETAIGEINSLKEMVEITTKDDAIFDIDVQVTNDTIYKFWPEKKIGILGPKEKTRHIQSSLLDKIQSKEYDFVPVGQLSSIIIGIKNMRNDRIYEEKIDFASSQPRDLKEAHLPKKPYKYSEKEFLKAFNASVFRLTNICEHEEGKYFY